MASRAPAVLFLDDVQWADAATLDVLDYAGRRWAEQKVPVLVVVAARPEEPEAGSTFEGWLSSLGRKLPTRSLMLGPLEDEDVEGLLGRLAGATPEPARASEEPGDVSRERAELKRFGEWLLSETGGQPFFLVETLKALLEEGKLVMRRSADGKPVVDIGPALRGEDALSGLLPQTVREVIRAPLAPF